MFKSQGYIREKQQCWHNPSNKQSRIGRFADFFINMNKFRSKKDYSGKCSQCAEPILPIIFSNRIVNFLSVALCFAAFYGAAFLSVCFTAWFSLNIFLVIFAFYCPCSWIMHRIVYSVVFGFFKWESYDEDAYNAELQQLQVRIRVNIERAICLLTFAAGGIQAVIMFR